MATIATVSKDGVTLGTMKIVEAQGHGICYGCHFRNKNTNTCMVASTPLSDYCGTDGIWVVE